MLQTNGNTVTKSKTAMTMMRLVPTILVLGFSASEVRASMEEDS